MKKGPVALFCVTGPHLTPFASPIHCLRLTFLELLFLATAYFWKTTTRVSSNDYDAALLCDTGVFLLFAESGKLMIGSVLDRQTCKMERLAVVLERRFLSVLGDGG